MVCTTAYKNPHQLLLNEIKTLEDGMSQYLEIARPNGITSITTNGYSILLAETVGGQLAYNAKGQLYIKAAFDLNGKQFQEGERYAVVGRSPQEASSKDLAPWVLSPQGLQLPSRLFTSFNWLTVKDNQMMVAFLLYSDSKSIFDRSVWPQRTRFGTNVLLSKEILQYTLENAIDAIIVGGLGSSNICPDVEEVFTKIVQFKACATPTFLTNPTSCQKLQSVPTSSSATIPLTINRCGAQWLPFLFNSYKHGRVS